MASRFEPVPASPEAAEYIGYVREVFKRLEEGIVSDLPPSRELSLALTALEEASHWLNRAIALSK